MSMTPTQSGMRTFLLSQSARLLGLALLWSAVLVGLQAAPVARVLSALLTSEEEKTSSQLDEDEALPGRQHPRRAARVRHASPLLYRQAPPARTPGASPHESSATFAHGLRPANRPADGLPLRC